MDDIDIKEAVSWFSDDERTKVIDVDVYCSDSKECEAFMLFLNSVIPPEYAVKVYNKRDIDNNLRIEFVVELGMESPTVAKTFISRITKEIEQHINIIRNGY